MKQPKSNSEEKSDYATDEEEFLGFNEADFGAELMQHGKCYTSTPLKARSRDQSQVDDNATIEVLEVDEQTLEAIEQQKQAEQQSVALKRKADEELQHGNEKIHRPSLESDLMTDDESVNGDQSAAVPGLADSQSGDAQPSTATSLEANDKNLSTPERLKRDGVRVSRDSGITSPEPASSEAADEVLAVIATEPVPSPQRRDSVGSADSFDTASNGMDSVEEAKRINLSKHDRELVEQAQQRYQEQVSEMQSLVEKVNRWHTHLKPILKQSQERGHFDIHEYGTGVLDSFERDTVECTFADVMRDKPKDSIARFFLSTLMLVNTGNLVLTTAHADPTRISEPQELTLKLKTRERQHEALENLGETLPYLAGDSGRNKKRSNNDRNQSPKAKKLKTS